MRLDGFQTALLAAACAHAAVSLVLASLRAPLTPPQPQEPPAELAIESNEWVPLDPATRPETLEPPVLLPAMRARVAERSGAMPAQGPTPAPEASAVPASGAAPWSFNASAPGAVGAEGYWKTVVTEGGGTTHPAPEPPPAPRSPDRILRDGLDAHDRALGLGSDGVLVTAAHEAASASIAPDVGTATLEIDCDAGGKVVAARVLASSGAPARWNAVARELVRIASSRTVRVPAGSRGVRTQLRIVAERLPPSGTKKTATPGAVPDDIAGGDEKVCVGEGAERKCLAGMPVGVTGTLGDVANIGARLARIVHVLVVGEQTL